MCGGNEARDILHTLIDASVVDVDNFNWISQLRYYWKYDDIGMYTSSTRLQLNTISKYTPIRHTYKSTKALVINSIFFIHSFIHSIVSISISIHPTSPCKYFSLFGPAVLCMLASIYQFTDKTDTIQVCMLWSNIRHGMEYLGNVARLIVTPQTDRCFR